MGTNLLKSFFLAGFECSCQRLRSGKRLNLTTATAHNRFALQDYSQLQSLGICCVRDGISWPEIETAAGYYDFSSVLPLVRAAHATGMQVIWDLWHYGWPDDLDLFAPQFISRFARFAHEFARIVAAESDAIPFYTPMNEISFVAWASGEVGYLNPFANHRGDEVKLQLVQAAIAAEDAIWSVDRRARMVHPDPVIHVAPDPTLRHEWLHACRGEMGQYEAWDMLAGTLCPEVGGAPRYLDIIGVNYYSNNQRLHNKEPLALRDPLYRPFRELLAEVHARYRRPLLIAETGAEGAERPGWLRYIGREVRAAMSAGVPVHGLTLYPILDYPGWDDDRYCPAGLWGYADATGQRQVYQPLARELRRQMQLFDTLQPEYDVRVDHSPYTPRLPRARWQHLGFTASRGVVAGDRPVVRPQSGLTAIAERP